jgi:hypothetical protein
VNFQDDDFASRMELATFKLFNRDSTATCFLVTPPRELGLDEKQVIIVTARHVFERMGGEQAILVLRTVHGDGSFTRRDFPVKIRNGVEPLWTHHPKMDVAVLPVALPDDILARPIDFDSLADEAALKSAGVHVGGEVLVLTYPMRNEANLAGFALARHASIASYPLMPIRLVDGFKLDFNTFAGDSGGPAFMSDPRHKEAGGNTPLVLGIVISQLREDEKTVLMNEERTVHVSMDLGNVVYAQFARETIQRLKK